MLCHTMSFAFPKWRKKIRNRRRMKRKNNRDLRRLLRIGTSFIPQDNHCTNFVKPETVGDGEHFVKAAGLVVKTSTGKTLTLKNLWNRFVRLVTTSSSNKKYCDPDMFESVKVKLDGEFRFSCASAQKFCSCISAVGTGAVEKQRYTATNAGKRKRFHIELTLSKGQGNGVQYQLSVNGHALHFLNVNDGDANNALGSIRRRRRLLQGGTSGSSC
eukprot:g4531.t1